LSQDGATAGQRRHGAPPPPPHPTPPTPGARLYVVRHGQTDWNLEPARCQGWAEVALNGTGRRQARELGERLRDAGIELIVASHLLRARQTAEELRDVLGHGIPMTIDPRLAESNRGAWQGRTFASIMKNDPGEWNAYREHPESFRFPSGESLAEQQRRVLGAVGDAARTGRVTLLVTHGGCIRLLGTFLDGRGIASFHEATTPNGAALELDEPDLAARIDRFLEAAART
jgi:broad specificity phosphatase PhoE